MLYVFLYEEDKNNKIDLKNVKFDKINYFKKFL